MTADRSSPRHRARIANLGHPINPESLEFGPVSGVNGRPTKVMAYVIDAADIDFVTAEHGGPAPVDHPDVPQVSLVGNDVEPDGKSTKTRPLVGWSLVVAAISDTVMGIAAIVTGSTLIGIVSSVAVGVCSIVLVVSEAVTHFSRSK